MQSVLWQYPALATISPQEAHKNTAKFMANDNPYRSINIDRAKMREGVEAMGATDYTYSKVGTSFQMSISIDGMPLKLCVHENKDGTTTLQKIGNFAPGLFEKTAEQINAYCGLGNGGSFHIAIPKVPPEHAENLLKYLANEGIVEVQKKEHGYTLTRFKGQQGDTITVKQYDNGTFQLQGRRAKLAVCAQDFLVTVLPYHDAVKAQLDAFSITIPVREVQAELEGGMPFAFSKLEPIVAAQLTTALILNKINVELPDYGAFAFPAVRGLEGFIKTELHNAGLEPIKANNFGEYFISGPAVNSYIMRDPAGEKVGEPRRTLLVGCYTLYANQRHGIAHMDADPKTSRVIHSLLEAQQIVTQVLETIESFHAKLAK